MKNTIQPSILKKLMSRQNLTQQALADLTVANHMPVGLATIKRICSPKGAPVKQRANTIASLAKALKVEHQTLTAGEAPANEPDDPLVAYVTMKARVTRNVELSYQSVEAIYGISHSAQVAMAPLFAALIAEASLKWRQERLETIGSIANKLENLRGDNPLLNGAFSRIWEAEKIEQRSIEKKDVRGQRALIELAEMYELAGTEFSVFMNHDASNLLPSEWVSPFSIFLQEYAKTFENAQIEIRTDIDDERARKSDGLPDYRVGQQLIDGICGKSKWAKRAIEDGYISINEIPKNLLGAEQTKERITFLKSRISQSERTAIAIKEIERLNEFRIYQGEEPLEITEERIAQILERLDCEDMP